MEGSGATINLNRIRIPLFISCLAAMCIGGMLYSWSVFVVSFEEEFGWTRSQTSLTYSLMVTCNTLFAVGAAFLARRVSYRNILRIAAVVGGAGLLLVAQMQSLYQLYLGFGMLFGGAMGFVYNASAASVIPWFPDHPSGASGILLMAYGFSSMVYGPLFHAGIEAFGWRRLFLILACSCLAILLICSMFLRMPTKEEQVLLPVAVRKDGASGEDSLTPGQMIRQPVFWLYCLWQVLMAACGMTLSGHGAPLAETAGATASAAALFAGLQSAGSGVGRIVFGFVYDRLRKITLMLVNAAPLIGGLLLLIAFHRGWVALLAVAYVILGIGFGGSPVSATGFVKYTFGSEHYARNLSIVNLSVLISSFVGPYFGGIAFQSFGYGSVCLMIFGYALAAVLVVIPIVRMAK